MCCRDAHTKPCVRFTRTRGTTPATERVLNLSWCVFYTLEAKKLVSGPEGGVECTAARSSEHVEVMEGGGVWVTLRSQPEEGVGRHATRSWVCFRRNRNRRARKVQETGHSRSMKEGREGDREVVFQMALGWSCRVK